MKNWLILRKPLCAALLAGMALFFTLPATTQTLATNKTENVIVVMLDGLRWQEVFRGADPELLRTPGPEALGNPKERAANAQRLYGRENATAGRQALMPFLWSVVDTEGQIFGNRDLGSNSQVINGLNFS